MSEPHSVATHQSGPLRLTGRRRPIWKDQREDVGEQGKLIYFAPNFSHSVSSLTTQAAVRAAGGVGAVKLGSHSAYLHLVDGGNDDGEVVQANGGRLIMTTNDADNDLLTLGFWGPFATAGVDRLPFLPVANSTVRFGVKCKINDVSTADFFCGLTVVDTDPFDAVTDGVYLTDLSTGTLKGVLEKNTNATSANIGTTADDTYFEAGFVVHGLSTVDFYFNGTKTQQTTVTNIDDDEPLVPVIGIRNSSGAASTLTVEKLACCQTIV